MSVVRHRTNERRIPGRGPLGPLRPLGPLGHLSPSGPALTAACALLTACAVLAGCTAGPGQPAFKPGGPPITLRIGVYGDPGYQRSGLYAEYERLHPNVRIVQTGRAAQAGYWQALQGALKSGRGLDDIQTVPVADIAAVTSSLAGDFVPLNTLGGVSGGTSAFADDWLPWVARQAANRAGTDLRARRGDRPDRDVLPDQPARRGRPADPPGGPGPGLVNLERLPAVRAAVPVEDPARPSLH